MIPKVGLFFICEKPTISRGSCFGHQESLLLSFPSLLLVLLAKPLAIPFNSTISFIVRLPILCHLPSDLIPLTSRIIPLNKMRVSSIYYCLLALSASQGALAGMFRKLVVKAATE
jgi:hypothetical protein